MKKSVVVILLFVMIAIFQFAACNNNPQISKNAQKGFVLAQKYCASCHQLPNPDLLNKETWLQHVLPKMGSLLSFTSLGSGRYFNSGAAAMSIEDWNNIVLYYYSQAPEQPLKRSAELKIEQQHDFFSVDTPSFSVIPPATTLVQVVPTKKQLLFADGHSQKLYIINNGIATDSFNVPTGVSHIKITDSAYWVLSMGVLHPSNEKLGRLTQLNLKTKKAITLIDSLQRPVDACYADLDNDGLEDIVIAEFGNSTGSLSLFKNKGTKGFKKQVLRSLPGSVKSIVYDFNKDGLPDIIALMAQGDEGVFIYYNKGNGQFKEKKVLSFPPSYGSNSLQLIDFNNDGKIDLMTTNGDNGDYPPILKAYHGIRLFANNGKNEFAQKAFLPVYGVGKAIANDFDGDGDLDIASISFFPDYEHLPEEAFLYWQNKGNNQYKPYSIKEATTGRWMVMEIGDIDADGLADIIVGNANFSLGAIPQSIKDRWDQSSPSILILKNKMHKNKKNKAEKIRGFYLYNE